MNTTVDHLAMTNDGKTSNGTIHCMLSHMLTKILLNFRNNTREEERSITEAMISLYLVALRSGLEVIQDTESEDEVKSLMRHRQIGTSLFESRDHLS